MEFEFDKEMDAILRKARGGGVAAAAVTPHVDADAIVAFAENALPDQARHTLTRHLADCDNCRRVLSQAISLNSEAVATAASDVSDIAIAEASVPWYSKILRSPGLAFAMGALVLTFGGVLGYLALQEQSRDAGTNVSQIREPEPATGGPSYSNEVANAEVADAAPSATPDPAADNTASRSIAANTAANSAGSVSTGKDLIVVLPPSAPMISSSKPARDETTGEESSLALTPGAPMSQPAKPTAKLEKQTDLGLLKSEDKESTADVSRQETDDDLIARNAVPPTRGTSGPIRSAKKRTDRERDDRSLSAAEQTSTRTVAGKTFDLRSGVWYDIAYKGQGTTNIRRGTDDFRKLDDGLRGIANSLEGVIIVVWKQKAYRIQ